MEPIQKKALVAAMRDLSRGDTELIAKMEAAIAHPPTKSEEIGYYVSGNETPFENCFRTMVSLLSGTPFATSAEDKYVWEIFDQWRGPGRLKELPPEFAALFPELLSGREPANPYEMVARIKQGYASGVLALERAFEETNEPLLSLDTGEGDTLVFFNAPKEITDRWREIRFGLTYDGVELGIRSPRWDRFWDHLRYALGLILENELDFWPDNLPKPRPMKDLSTVVME